MGPWASGSGVLGNGPGEGAASMGARPAPRRYLAMGGAGGAVGRGKSVAASGGAAASRPRTGTLRVSSRSGWEVSATLCQSASLCSPALRLLRAPSLSSSYLQAGFYHREKKKKQQIPNKTKQKGKKNKKSPKPNHIPWGKRGLFRHVVTQPNPSCQNYNTHTKYCDQTNKQTKS